MREEEKRRGTEYGKRKDMDVVKERGKRELGSGKQRRREEDRQEEKGVKN